MKVWLVKGCEEYGDSYPIKVFRSKERALQIVANLKADEEKSEFPTYIFYVSEIEADLNE